jgi:hypothetical protein
VAVVLSKPTSPYSSRTRPKDASAAPSADDFQDAMAAVATRVEGCFSGPRREPASLRVTISPSGEASRVRLSPPFSGTPVEVCVQRAVDSLGFQPWTGSTRTFSYRIAPSELRAVPAKRSPEDASAHRK